MEIDPRSIVRAALFALMGLLGLVSLIISPWIGVVLVLVAVGGVAHILLPWEGWLPRKERLPSSLPRGGRACDLGARRKETRFQ
jgi:hypothetical protein